MSFNLFSVLILFLQVSTFISCNEYQKLLNSDDASEKYKQAELYYNNGEYRKANRLFEQIIPKYRAKPQAQRIIFFFADSYFQTKSYYLASYQYENFIIQLQQIVEYATQKMKTVDASGHYESDDETSFFFEQLKELQVLFNEIFETEKEKENSNAEKKEK